MNDFFAAHKKSISALIGGVLTWGATAQDSGITAAEWWGLAIAAASALGVFAVRNVPDTEPADGGQSTLAIIVVVVLILILIGAIR